MFGGQINPTLNSPTTFSSNLDGVIIDEESGRPAVVYIEQVVVLNGAVKIKNYLHVQRDFFISQMYK